MKRGLRMVAWGLRRPVVSGFSLTRGRPAQGGYYSRFLTVLSGTGPHVLVSVVFATFVFSSSVSAQAPTRIISLVPALTEMVFAIGAGPQVVAVSSFDTEPPEVLALPRVGALLDPNTERILALRPDLVLVYGSQIDLLQQLERARVPTFLYRHGGLAEVSATISALGQRTGHRVVADRLASSITSRLAALRTSMQMKVRPRTMLVFGRERGTLRGIFASGGRGFLHDMIEAAGGRNVFAEVTQESVEASTEMILARAPDVILEVRSSEVDVLSAADEGQAWARLASIPAVKTGRIHVMTGRMFVVPGPRVADAAVQLARVLHPGVTP